jgi:hypothetical protein
MVRPRKSPAVAWRHYGLAFALLSLGGLAYSMLHATVWIFALAAVAVALVAVAPHRRRVVQSEQQVKGERRRYVTQPLPRPRRVAPARQPSPSAMERHYLAVVASELRRLGRDYRVTPKAGLDGRPDGS